MTERVERRERKEWKGEKEKSGKERKKRGLKVERLDHWGDRESWIERELEGEMGMGDRRN